MSDWLAKFLAWDSIDAMSWAARLGSPGLFLSFLLSQFSISLALSEGSIIHVDVSLCVGKHLQIRLCRGLVQGVGEARRMKSLLQG